MLHLPSYAEVSSLAKKVLRQRHWGQDWEDKFRPDDPGRCHSPENPGCAPGQWGAENGLPDFPLLWQLMVRILTHQPGLPIHQVGVDHLLGQKGLPVRPSAEASTFPACTQGSRGSHRLSGAELWCLLAF